MNESLKIGRYEIISEKGRGAMGAVYLARDPAMDRIVALKTIHSTALTGPLAQEYRERFFRETRSAGALAHPGIVTVFDAGEQDGVPYLVMEFIEGQNLAEAAKSGERFTFDRVCEIGQQIAEALAYAHANGVIHRDIKPANILMTSREKYGVARPKITDFGVAKIGNAQITTTGQVLGTPAFMPPEQFTGAPIDGRGDIFSLGVILYWMATGEYAFPGETVTSVSYKVVHTEPVPPQKLNPAVPHAFDQIILRCLAKSPADRYSTGDDLARDLGALRAGPVTSELQNVAPAVSSKSTGMDSTLDTPVAPTRVRHAAHRTAASQPRQPAPHHPLRRALITVGAVTAAILLLGSWYGYTHREKIVSILNPDSAPQTIDEPDTASEPEPLPARNPARKAPVTPKPGKTTVKPPEPVNNSLAALPVPPRVNFDPKKLDPDTNAKLKIEADHFPPNVAFTVEMNGKVYFERGASSPQDVFEDLYVPPAVTEFRVIAGEVPNRKTSNIVSAEFKSKKKKVLRIELRTQGQKAGAGMPAGVYPDSQIVVTLK